MARKAKKAKAQGKRRSRQEVQELLTQVESMRNSGEPLMKSLDKLGISYSNYNYWTKKRGATAGAGPGRGRGRAAAATSKSGVIAVLEEMSANRAERQQLEHSITVLDAKYKQLKSKLDRG